MSDINKVYNIINSYLDLKLDAKGKPFLSEKMSWVAQKDVSPRDLLDVVINRFDLESPVFRDTSIESITKDGKSLHSDVSVNDWNTILDEMGKHYYLDLYVYDQSGNAKKITLEDKATLIGRLSKASTLGAKLDALKEAYGPSSSSPLLKMGLAACCLGATFFIAFRAIKNK